MRARALLALALIAVDHGGASYRGHTPETLAAAGVPAPVILAGARAVLKSAIDTAAESERLHVITPGAGQAAEYQQALTEAFEALGPGGTADAARFPMLAASIGLDLDPQTGAPAVDVLGVARSVRAAAEAWTQRGAQIRRVRLTVKAAIDAAPDLPSACAAFDVADWSPV